MRAQNTRWQSDAPHHATADDALPELGSAPDDERVAWHLAMATKAFGERSIKANGLGKGKQARKFALLFLRDILTEKITNQATLFLSRFGNAAVKFQMDEKGKLTGSNGTLFTPLIGNPYFLTWGQVGVTQLKSDSIASLGLGQRWLVDHWILGYNMFYDACLRDRMQRVGIGGEVWGDFLRLSANYYWPLSGWWQADASLQGQSMARGYDITAQAWLPFYRYIHASVSVEQYFGERVDLLNKGGGYRNPVAIKIGLSYTPVPLLTLTAQYKEATAGPRQNSINLRFNYRFDVPLAKQLSAAALAVNSSLRGSRYDRVKRSSVPKLDSRQHKTLSVFLATPPWDLQPGETVVLKLQVNSQHGIRYLDWHGDTQVLSLTPPMDNEKTQGWTIIIPPWNDVLGADNRWSLSVTVEDDRGQRATSNVISLVASAPLLSESGQGSSYSLLTDKLDGERN